MLSAVWLGMVIGVSFVATPVKFMAPSLELATALEVGRVTFFVFSRLEWLLALAAVALATVIPAPRALAITLAVLVAILVIQTGWLLPALDARVAAVLNGEILPPSWHHSVYALLEAGKAALLLSLIVIAALHLASRR